MATPLENIDRELGKAAAALRKARVDLDFGRTLALWDDTNDLLERRFLLREAGTGG